MNMTFVRTDTVNTPISVPISMCEIIADIIKLLKDSLLMFTDSSVIWK